MAKKHSSRGGTAAKSEHKAVKVVAVLIVILAVAYVIAALALGRQWNPVKWVKKDKPTNPTAAVVAVSDTGEAMYAGGKYAMPRAMTVTQDTTFAPTGEFIITAELTNEYVNGVFEWSAAWVNALSEWATGKNVYDYCEMSAATDGSGGAAFKVKAPFAEQITISAKLVGTESADTCTVDYLRRAGVNRQGLCFSDFDDCYDFDTYYTLDTGTVTGEFSLEKVYVNFASGFIDDFKSILKFDVEVQGFNPINNGIEFETSYYSTDYIDFYSNVKVQYSDFIIDFDSFSEAQKQAIYYAWYTAFQSYKQYDDMGRNLLLDIQIGYSYKGVGVDGFAESDLPCSWLSGSYYFDSVDIDVVLKGGYVV